MKRLSHRINLRIALLMVLALLGAQLAAQAHAYSHFQVATHATHGLPGHGGACLDCLSFAPLLASAGGPSQAPWIAPRSPRHAPDSIAPTLIAPTPAHAFRSRAPPSTR